MLVVSFAGNTEKRRHDDGLEVPCVYVYFGNVKTITVFPRKDGAATIYFVAGIGAAFN